MVRRGDLIDIRTADGSVVRRRALGDVDRGDTFPVVWATKPEDWDAAVNEGREPSGIPWPEYDVSVAEPRTPG